MEITYGLSVLVTVQRPAYNFLYCMLWLAYILQAAAIGLPFPYEQVLPVVCGVNSEQASVKGCRWRNFNSTPKDFGQKKKKNSFAVLRWNNPIPFLKN